MSSGHVILAPQAAWDTPPSTGWRELELSADTFAHSHELLTYDGLRANGAAPRASGRRKVKEKGTGSIELPFFSTATGMILRACASTATSAVVVDGTLAFAQKFGWTAAGVPLDRCLAAEVYRDQYDGDFDAYSYFGGRGTQLDLSIDTSGHLLIKAAFDFKEAIRQPSLPARTIAEPDIDFIYAWPDVELSLRPLDGGSAVVEGVDSFSLSIPQNLDVDDYRLRRGASRRQPKRKGAPAPTGALAMKYEDPKFYDAWRSGRQYELVANWVAPEEIEEDTFPSLDVVVACLEWNGSDPVVTKDDPTTQQLPFHVLDLEDGEPVISIESVTSDTTY